MDKSNKVKKCVGKEGFERMNYLYQISTLMAINNSSCTNIISTLYTNLMINVSRKTCQRLDIGVKRTICKCCRSLLLAGVTCKVRVKKKNIIWTCDKCYSRKTFETKTRDYEPWTLKPESIVQTLNYALNAPPANSK